MIGWSDTADVSQIIRTQTGRAHDLWNTDQEDCFIPEARPAEGMRGRSSPTWMQSAECTVCKRRRHGTQQQGVRKQLLQQLVQE